MRRTNRFCTMLLSAGLAAGLSLPALAVPYASGVRNTTGSMWEFVLNEAANNVSITRDGGNVLNLGGLGAGRHTFDLGGFSTFDIDVSNSATSGWTWLNNTAALHDDFERPTGLAVNNIPNDLAYFGMIYVNNSTEFSTVTGRTMGDALYALTADIVSVDPATFAALSDTNIPATPAGWNVGGSSNSAWRLGLDDSGNILATDWSDGNGGVKYAMRDMSASGPLLNQQAGPTFGVTNSFGDAIHGSIVSKPYATGTVGVDLTLYAMDEDMEAEFGVADGNNVWRWNVGAQTDYSGTGSPENDFIVPDLIIDPGSLVAGSSLSPNVTAGAATDSDGQPWFLNLNVGVLAEVHFNQQHDKWYLTSPRDNGHDSSTIIVTDASDPQTVLWSSKQFSIDNGLDGFIGDGCDPNLCDGIQDIFREAWAVDFSNDGTEMYLGISVLYDAAANTNPVIGPASPNLHDQVLVIPLDANGLPDIQVNDNGTPGDPSDDFLANVTSIPVDTGESSGIRFNIDVDAAGNLYVTSNISEKLEVWSPGGNTTATTSWDGSVGSFMLAGAPGGLLGDHNGDGTVDAADYVLWRSDPGSYQGAQGYTDWVNNFGQSLGSGSGPSAGGAVPEPGSFVLALAGLLLAGACRRRR